LVVSGNRPVARVTNEHEVLRWIGQGYNPNSFVYRDSPVGLLAINQELYYTEGRQNARYDQLVGLYTPGNDGGAGSLNWRGVCERIQCNAPPPSPSAPPGSTASPPPPPPPNPCPTLWSCGPYKTDKPRDEPPRDEIGTGHPGVEIIGPNVHSRVDYIGDPVQTTSADATEISRTIGTSVTPELVETPRSNGSGEGSGLINPLVGRPQPSDDCDDLDFGLWRIANPNRSFACITENTATGEGGGVSSPVPDRSFPEIETPHGIARQHSSPGALAARQEVGEGATIWRMGTTERSRAAEAQFWTTEHPSTPGFAQRYGIPPANVANADFIESGWCGRARRSSRGQHPG
jgi:hypothetical protein